MQERQTLAPIVAAMEPEQESDKVFYASQWQLMRWRFAKHKLAMFSLVVVALLYLTAAFCEFIAPYDPNRYFSEFLQVPPQPVRLLDDQGKLSWPFVYGLKRTRNPETLAWTYEQDRSAKHTIHLWVRTGQPYKFWGLWETDRHLFGIQDPQSPLFLVGSDRLGRDVLSRVIYGTRPSMTIGLVGVMLSLFLGILLGGISGYFGGWLDILIQRIIEILSALPHIPLWMGLAAAVPLDWPIMRVYFMITIILSLIGWTGLARVVRGRFLSLRTEDFVMAARIAGSGELRVILRHMLPSFMSHIIANVTLAIPGMILAETSLSFLGLGLRPPAVSWGVLLQDAQNLRTVALAPWNLLPAIPVVAAVLTLNFVGDGLRDAADPYAR